MLSFWPLCQWSPPFRLRFARGGGSPVRATLCLDRAWSFVLHVLSFLQYVLPKTLFTTSRTRFSVCGWRALTWGWMIVFPIKLWWQKLHFPIAIRELKARVMWYSQTSLIRSSFIRIPRHPEENCWSPIYSNAMHTHTCVFDYPVPSPIRIFLWKTDVCG